MDHICFQPVAMALPFLFVDLCLSCPHFTRVFILCAYVQHAQQQDVGALPMLGFCWPPPAFVPTYGTKRVGSLCAVGLGGVAGGSAGK